MGTQQTTMQAQLHAQTTQLQAQAYVHEQSMQLELELTRARAEAQTTQSQEQHLEKRVAQLSKELNGFMEEIHAHDQKALEYQRIIRKQTKANEDLMDASTADLKRKDRVIEDL